MGSDQHFCLRWNNFHSNIAASFEYLRDHEDFVDVTLACEGRSLKAHKVVLSACSPYFRNLLKQNPCQHPIIIMRDVAFVDVSALLSFVYQGEVYVSQDRLPTFLKTAEMLHIKGLTEQQNQQYHMTPSGTTLTPTTTVTTRQSSSPPPLNLGPATSLNPTTIQHNKINRGQSPPNRRCTPSPPTTTMATLQHISPPPKKRKPLTVNASNSPNPHLHHRNLTPSPGTPPANPTVPPPLEGSTLAAALTKPQGLPGGISFTRTEQSCPPRLLSAPLPSSVDVPKVKQEQGEAEGGELGDHETGQAVNLVMEGSILRQRIQGYQGSPDAPLPHAQSNNGCGGTGTGGGGGGPPLSAVIHPVPPQRKEEDSPEDTSYPAVEGGAEVAGEMTMLGGSDGGQGSDSKEAMATSPMVIRPPLIGILPREQALYTGAGTSGSLSHHESSQEDNPYEARPCPVCNKQISNRANLKKHLKIRHSTQEEATCPYCFKLFRNKYSLWTHINSYHPGVKTHPPPPHPHQVSGLQLHVQQHHPEYLPQEGSSGSMSGGDNSIISIPDDKYGGPHG